MEVFSIMPGRSFMKFEPVWKISGRQERESPCLHACAAGKKASQDQVNRHGDKTSHNGIRAKNLIC